ncbi:MAG: hypothetical protein HQM13_15735 [SAR324 cluster bacterium]|nr:hypothetical protein [SAR324 cluster bacterium]
MPKRRINSQLSQRHFTGYIGPLAIGAGYAVSKIMTIRWLEPELAPHADFKLFVLSGLFLGIIIRPVLQRIYWFRRTSFVFVALMLLLMGPLSTVPEYLMWGRPIDQLYLKRMIPEIIPLLVVTLLGSLILSPSQFQLTMSGMVRRLIRQISWSWWVRVGVGAGGYVILFLIFRVAFYSLGHWESPLENLNSFFVSPETTWAWKLVYLWEQGILLVLAILPIHNILIGKPHELALIFGSLLFVVGDFVPTFANIHGNLPFEIIDQIIQRLFIDFIFCYAVMLLFDKSPLSTIPKENEG